MSLFSIFCQNLFVPQCRTISSVSPLVFHRFRVSEIFWISWGEHQDLLSNIFCLTVPKIFVAEHFTLPLFSGIEKFHASEDYVFTFDFLSNFFVSQCRKIS